MKEHKNRIADEMLKRKLEGKSKVVSYKESNSNRREK